MRTDELQRHLIAFAVLHGGLGDYGTRGDGVRDDDGIDGPRTRAAFAAFRRMRGGSAGTDELRAAIQETQCGASLGMRALAFALREWCAGVREEPPGSNSGPRIREYLAPCVRDGRLLRLTSGEWCAASASWCAFHAKREGERLPHGYRAAGIELQRDLEKAGSWRPIADVRAGRYLPRPGDLVITKRGSQAWQRHVCRLVAHRGEYLWTLGGNENNRWMLTPRKLASDELLGLGAYPFAAEDDARFLGYKPRECDCTECRRALVERLARDPSLQ